MVIMMELQLQPLAAEGNGLLARNPDRGLRLELYMGGRSPAMYSPSAAWQTRRRILKG